MLPEYVHFIRKLQNFEFRWRDFPEHVNMVKNDI